MTDEKTVAPPVDLARLLEEQEDRERRRKRARECGTNLGDLLKSVRNDDEVKP